MPDAPLLHDLGEAIRRRRRGHGWSRRELAARSRISERFLADVERGHGNPSVLRLAAIAEALGVTADALLRGTRASVALLGLRGAGKSTVGALLAARLSCAFIELDHEIETEVGLGLSEIFEVHGADYFRQAERETLERVLSRDGSVVLATGGGLVTDAETFALLRAQSQTVWLRARPEDHWTRVVAQGDTRPMEGNERAFASLCALLSEREKLYRQADLTIDTSGRAPDTIVEELAALW